MFKKILSTALAMAMVLSMAVSTSAALGKPGSSTPSTKTEQSSSSSKKSSSSSSSSKGHDLCKTQLAKDKLALSMHHTFMSGSHHAFRARHLLYRAGHQGIHREAGICCIPEFPADDF